MKSSGVDNLSPRTFPYRKTRFIPACRKDPRISDCGYGTFLRDQWIGIRVHLVKVVAKFYRRRLLIRSIKIIEFFFCFTIDYLKLKFCWFFKPFLLARQNFGMSFALQLSTLRIAEKGLMPKTIVRSTLWNYIIFRNLSINLKKMFQMSTIWRSSLLDLVHWPYVFDRTCGQDLKYIVRLNHFRWACKLRIKKNWKNAHLFVLVSRDSDELRFRKAEAADSFLLRIGANFDEVKPRFVFMEGIQHNLEWTIRYIWTIKNCKNFIRKQTVHFMKHCKKSSNWL